MKNTCPFYIVSQVLKVLFIKIFKKQPADPLFLVAFISFYISRYFSQSFRTSFNVIWKKKKNFVTNVIFLMDSLRPLLPTHTLNCQNLLSVTKAFCQCSLICSLLTIVILYAVAMGVSVFTIWPFQGQMTKEKLIQCFQCFEI